MPITHVTKQEHRQLQNIANILASSQKVVIITGAGISTNCGIPDFRSEEGLYALIQANYGHASTTASQQERTAKRLSPIESSKPIDSLANALPSNVRGKALFDARIWKDPISTSVFYAFIASLRKKIREEVKQVTPTHRFIKTIRDSSKLVRCYTQNIDGLEARIGLSMDLDHGKGSRTRFIKKSRTIPKKSSAAPKSRVDGGCEVVPLHGDLAVLRCTLCQQTCGWEDVGREASMLQGKAPECFSCATMDQQRRDRGKRGTKIGSLRPNIVLYGEEHPAADAVGSITTHDLSLAPDVLLILGTSLHVHGLKTLVKEFAKCVHARPNAKGKVIFVNLSKPSESMWTGSIDYWVSMDCDEWIDTLKRHRPDIWQLQTELTAHVRKRVNHPLPKSSSPSKARGIPDDKENRITVQIQVPRSPHKPSARPKLDALREIQNNSSHQIRDQDSMTGSASRSLIISSSQSLPTPPTSTHKHTVRIQERKRSRPSDDVEHPMTPTKKPRLPPSPARENILKPKPSSLASSRARPRYSASKRKAVIEIWED
ncbi:MAG: hypothetical protein Q9182_004850 [Xanthomendoza sp. 2 TL-2023]